MGLTVAGLRGPLASLLYFVEAVLGKLIEDGKDYKWIFLGISIWGVLLSLSVLSFLDLFVWAFTIYAWKDLLEEK